MKNRISTVILFAALAAGMIGCGVYEEGKQEKGVLLKKPQTIPNETVPVEKAHIATTCQFPVAKKSEHPDAWNLPIPFQKLGNEQVTLQEALKPLRNDSELIFLVNGGYYLTPGIPGWLKEQGQKRIEISCFDGQMLRTVEYGIREGDGRFMILSPSADVVTGQRAIAVAASKKGGGIVVVMRYYINGELQRPSEQFPHVSGAKPGEQKK